MGFKYSNPSSCDLGQVISYLLNLNIFICKTGSIIILVLTISVGVRELLVKIFFKSWCVLRVGSGIDR